MAGNKNSGRRPLPTGLHVLRGNPGKRPLPENEPQPEPATEDFDVPPAELSYLDTTKKETVPDVIAVAEWTRVAPMLRLCGMISSQERGTLISLCLKWSEFLRAHHEVQDRGMVVKTETGIPIVNPYLKISNEALTQCRKLWVELGLTPSSRSRLSALPIGPQDAEKKSTWHGLL